VLLYSLALIAVAVAPLLVTLSIIVAAVRAR
jgi:hypothetical protein